jgi:hypothetical protein
MEEMKGGVIFWFWVSARLIESVQSMKKGTVGRVSDYVLKSMKKGL